jgi:hypothetical protein
VGATRQELPDDRHHRFLTRHAYRDRRRPGLPALAHRLHHRAPRLRLDKFAGLLTDWEQYLAPWIDDLVPGTAHHAMLAVGVVEVVAGVAVALAPRWGALVVAAWLAGIIVNLVTMGEYLDVALRDLGLLVGAHALAVLASDRSRVRG